MIGCDLFVSLPANYSIKDRFSEESADGNGVNDRYRRTLEINSNIHHE